MTALFGWVLAWFRVGRLGSMQADATAATFLARAHGRLRAHQGLLYPLLIVSLGVIIYLPYLGSFPLWDPWEPHYSQVAWEMAQHHTWLDPYYRGVANWWSKPIFMLWMLRASFAWLWDSVNAFADVALAARLPFALSAIIGGLLQYDWVRRLFGRKVALLAALVLLTAPQYVLIGRQVMADMPFVVAYSASLGYLAVGLFAQRRAVPPAAQGLALWRGRWTVLWPFVVFWALQAVAMLTKGFLPAALTVLVVAGYGAATFRWRDYAMDLSRGALLLRLVAAAVLVSVAVLGARELGASLPDELRLLCGALLIAAAALLACLGLLHPLPPCGHALRLLQRIHSAWGVGLVLALAAPWFTYMTIQHGWPYWKEFIFYHHLGRAAGSIGKPHGSFEIYVQQIAYGLLPWSGFLVGALWQVAGRASPWRSVSERKNLFVLLAVLLPYLFFTLAGTKFAHYIFPVVPFLAVLIAAALAWMGDEAPKEPPLCEGGPPLGGQVPAYSAAGPRWWHRDGAKGDLVVFAALSLVTFGIFAHDAVLDFRHFLQLFIYYQHRATPEDYQPYIVLQLLLAPAGIAMGLLLVSRFVGPRFLAATGASAIALACFLGWSVMPAMGNSFTYEPLYRAYKRLAHDNEPIGQYNDWQQPERSVIFLFQNHAQHLRNDNQAKSFLGRPGRKFIIVDRNRLTDIRKVAAEVGTKLYVVSRDHPYARLLSDVPTHEEQNEVSRHILTHLPGTVTLLNADFGGKIRLLGYELAKARVAPGEDVKVKFYYQAETLIERDWRIFVHGDGPIGQSERLLADHFPVGGLYFTSEWQEGEIVEDVFTLHVPVGYPFDHFQLYTGWYAGERRLNVAGPAITDGNNRVRGPQIEVSQ